MERKEVKRMVNLAEVRKAAGMTQADLGKRVGVVRQAIGNIETGLSKPSIKVAKRIGSVLNFDWTEFFEREV
jgi:DNA-binding XRE family transcriptional regulator